MLRKSRLSQKNGFLVKQKRVLERSGATSKTTSDPSSKPLPATEKYDRHHQESPPTDDIYTNSIFKILFFNLASFWKVAFINFIFFLTSDLLSSALETKNWGPLNHLSKSFNLQILVGESWEFTAAFNKVVIGGDLSYDYSKQVVNLKIFKTLDFEKN